jgi:alpha-mannosidase
MEMLVSGMGKLGADPHADEVFHEFTYALYPHAGDWKAAETERRG